MLKVKAKTGSFFPGVSPDLCAALAVASYAKRTCVLDYPLFVPGSSGASTAGSSGMKKHVGRLEDQAHLPLSCVQNWSDIVPAFFSVETIWAEASVGALRATGRNDVLSDFNVPLLYGDCVMWHPSFLPIMLRRFFPALRATNRGAVRGTCQFTYRMLYLTWRRAKSLMTRLLRAKPVPSQAHTINGLENIDEAVLAFSAHMVSTGRRFDMVI